MSDKRPIQLYDPMYKVGSGQSSRFNFEDMSDSEDQDEETVVSESASFLNDLFSNGNLHGKYLGQNIDSGILSLEDLCTFVKSGSGRRRLSASFSRDLMTFIVERDPQMFDETIGEKLINCLQRVSKNQRTGFDVSDIDCERLLEEIINQSGYVPVGGTLFGFGLSLFKKYYDQSMPIAQAIDSPLSGDLYTLDQGVCRFICDRIIEEGIPPEDEIDYHMLGSFLHSIFNTAQKHDSTWVLKLIESIAYNRADHMNVFHTFIQMNDWTSDEITIKKVVEHIYSCGFIFEPPYDDYVQSMIITHLSSPSEMINMSDRFKTYMPFIRNCIPREAALHSYQWEMAGFFNMYNMGIRHPALVFPAMMSVPC